MAKRLFIYDFRKKKGITDEGIFQDALVDEIDEEVYGILPGVAEIAILVTIEQKRAVVYDFSPNSTRYIDGSDEPFRFDKDILVYSSATGDICIISEPELQRFGVMDRVEASGKPCAHREWKLLKEVDSSFVQECVDCKMIQVAK